MNVKKVLPVILIILLAGGAAAYFHYTAKSQTASLFNLQSVSTQALPVPTRPTPTPVGCALTVQALPTPAAQAVPIVTTNFDFAHIKFSAPSTCSIKLESAEVAVLYASPSLLPGLLANVKVINLGTGAQIGSTIATLPPNPHPQNYNLFAMNPNITIPAGTSVTLSFRADAIGQYGSGEPMAFGVTSATAIKVGTTTPASNNIANGIYGQGMTTSNSMTCTTSMTYAFSEQWGTVGSGNGQLDEAEGIVADHSGNLYLVDSENSRIEKFTPNGAYITQWGAFGHGNGQFDDPFGIALDSSGNVYVTDEMNDRVEKFSSAGVLLSQWGTAGSGNGQFNSPEGIAVDSSGNVYVVDKGNSRIEKFTSTGTYITKWGNQGTGNGQFHAPNYLAVDSSGDVYVVDPANSRIEKFSSSGSYITQWGTEGSGNGQFDDLKGIAIDTYGSVYVSDSGNNRIQKFLSSGTYLTQWTRMGGLEDLTVDSSGNVFVIGSYEDIVLKFKPVCPTT